MVYDGPAFQNKYVPKVASTCWFYILLHDTVEILDKRVFNQVNRMDAVIFLYYCLPGMKFVLSIYY